MLAEATNAVRMPLGYAKAISAWFVRGADFAPGIAMAAVGMRDSVIPHLRLPRGLVEPRGIEPLTFALRTRRSPS